jgi:hypothetical protein
MPVDYNVRLIIIVYTVNNKLLTVVLVPLPRSDNLSTMDDHYDFAAASKKCVVSLYTLSSLPE